MRPNQNDNMNTVISTQDAPTPVGPYSQAIRTGATVYCAGQIPVDPKTEELVAGDIANQTQRVLENLRAVLAAANLGTADIVKTTVFLADLNDYQAMNEVYGGFFGDRAPARTTIAVAGLPGGARIEIDAIAVSG